MVDAPKIRMTAKEFMELPESNLPNELIDGELIVSPAPVDRHQKTLRSAFRYLDRLVTHGEWLFAPLDVHFDDGNITQPDLFWISGEESQCKLGADGYWYGAPDLVIEVLSPGTQKNDRGKKFDLYELHGVREYWLTDTIEKFVEVYRLQENTFVRIGVFGVGDKFTSTVLNVEIDVDGLLNS
jgi:Uma2 family endonuclease